ncbi:MAG: ATP synthase F1 subunit delta [Rickettsiaceae bacterium]|nr:ATP synthase F1 subunit delta [Rickettsiaceae bacterium]
MIIDEKIVKNYAYSLYELAGEQKNQLTILQNLQLLQNILNQHTDLVEALISPLIVPQTKIRIINTINQRIELQELVINFLSVLVKNNRISLLESIIDTFEKYYKASHDIKIAQIDAASKVTKTEQAIIKDYLEKQFNTKFDLKIKINHRLIGGIRVNYGSTLIDLSLLGALSKIHRKLQNA